MTNVPLGKPLSLNILAKESLTPGFCEHCGTALPEGVADSCCSLPCEAQLNRLEALQGRAIIRELKRWRMKPNHAARNAAIAEIVPRVDKFLSYDQRRREIAAEERRTEARIAQEIADEAEKKAAEKASEKASEEAAKAT